MQNISAKMVAVMKECAHVLKNGTNNFHGYKYATSSDVLEKVNAALVQNGISSMAMPELINCIDVTNTKGNKEHLATVKITITLTDSTSGESVTIVGLGSGQDAGDKAVMKAQDSAKADMVSHSACIASKSGRRQHKNVLESIQMYSIYQQLPKLIFNIICVIKGQ